MKKILISLMLGMLCFSCGTVSANDIFLKGQLDIALEEAKANTERIKALGSFTSELSDPTSRVVAIMALGNFGHSEAKTQIRMPKSGWDTAREWVGMFLGPLTQMYGIKVGGDVSMNNSDNNRMVSISTNESFVGIAGKIQAPASNLTIGGSGVIGDGTYSTDTHNISSSYNPTSEQNPIDNSIDTDNSNQGNPVDNRSNYENPVSTTVPAL